uniref:Uncharacterized protein n=1 Tax=Pyrodinium bahamense TaxID=73915 RepID=A0A7R9ZYJ6_9DINO
MAASGALNVVRQIQTLAEGPRTPEMRECLGQVVSSLLFFLDHPDSRVRLSAARTLVKLSRGYTEDMQRFDLGRARSALARCRKADADGAADVDNEELQQLLGEMLAVGEPLAARPDGAVSSAAVPAPAPTETAVSSTTGGSDAVAAGDDRGQVVLKVGQNTNGKLKAAILEGVVVLTGVVSVTFEGSFVIVATKTPVIAADASFLADLLTAVKEQGLQGVSLVNTAAGACSAGDTLAAGSTAREAEPGWNTPAAENTAGGEQHGEEVLEDEVEPAYLDDDEDETAGPAGTPGMLPGVTVGDALAGGPQWSFFSQTNWMTGRRLQEFGDDPTIAARLAKAKKREEEKKEEERSRIGRLSNWLMGGR